MVVFLLNSIMAGEHSPRGYGFGKNCDVAR